MRKKFTLGELPRVYCDAAEREDRAPPGWELGGTEAKGPHAGESYWVPKLGENAPVPRGKVAYYVEHHPRYEKGVAMVEFPAGIRLLCRRTRTKLFEVHADEYDDISWERSVS